MAGFIKIYRDVLDTLLFTRPDFLQMWLYLSKLARFVKTEQDGIEILPGQVLTSVSELAQCCRRPERRVRYILDSLEKMDLIRRENIRNRYTLITLINPDELRSVKQVNLSESVGTEKTDTQPKCERKTDVQIQAKPVQQTNSQIQAKHAQETITQPQPKPVLQTEMQLQPKIVQQTDTQMQTKTVPQEDAQPQPKIVQQTDTQSQPKRGQETDTQSKSAPAQKACFGLCRNVYLTAEEKQLLQKRSPVADSYIEKLSAYKRRTNKMYADDFAVLCEWISGDEISKKEKQPPAAPKPMAKTAQENTPIPSLSRHQGFNTDFFTAPASYDLERAEQIARTTVPTLRKRNR